MPDADGSVPPARRALRLRPWLRALHRDAGYFIVGLTIVYAVSGIAVNHVGDWDPSFVNVERRHTVDPPIPDDDSAAATVVLGALGIDEAPKETFRTEATELSISLEGRTLTVNTATGAVLEQGQDPRFFLRVANWLHLNRGKKAWTYFADAFAVLLLFLAISGLFMIPGRKGLLGRGALIATLGAAVPLGYLVLFGGP